ncbi:2-hydroxychromene-2-carboxylate isomerase [Jannaschia seohaensis]|uniref:2-hydroxychromene-2-carboxylate isomerase n=1 Tax=Jannaschia seohaensis TaxID=475081 RepID=A0A2Y9ANU0_9RHOB|nr:2-hydroxychromene-2-carboxylate isomerase [Jannaschia seohaensis]PWJ19111.1 2-hydroxychromene-2-carboxylate isomerase [Jannaschia seohaensis]SSA45746.1 2-hydroxychromene-2-carboxylate isomerase [Jannaschia seohaensis]
MRIDYYFATISPFTYLAGTRLEEVAAKHGAEVAYKPLNLADLFLRTGGTPLPERHENRKVWRLQQLRRTAAALGMPINLQPAHWPTNPAPSSYAIIAAAKDGSGDVGALVAGLTRACWAEERDIAQDDVIADCLEAAGFDRALVNRGMMEGAETYARNLEDAVAAGAFGVPFYIVGDERFWGQDSIGELDAYLATL